MIFINVVVIKDSVIDENYLFRGDDKSDVAQRAEQKFLDACAKNVPNWDGYSEEDKKFVLEDGFAEFGAFGSVCISWPDTDT